MSRSKKKFEPKPWERYGSSKLSASIYATMMQSEAWKDLSNNAKVLYLYMKLQLYGVVEKPQNNADYFVFNKALYMNDYGLYTNGEQFTRDCHELIKNGFIKEIENGHTTKTKNIYAFTWEWQTWKKGDDYRPVAMRIHDEELRAKRSEQSRNRRKKANEKNILASTSPYQPS